MAERPTISFVVIEYFSVDDLLECVASIREHAAGMAHEIVISSNSVYPQGKRIEMTERIPNVQWVFNDANLGFAGGMNAGIRMTKADFFVMINPDARLVDDGLTKALNHMYANPDVAVIGPRMVDESGKTQDSCRRFMTPADLAFRTLKRLRSGRKEIFYRDISYDRLSQVDWVIGGFMLVRRAAAGKVGLLDEGYYLYVEDMDWCMRFWKAGYEVVFFPELTVAYVPDRKSVSLAARSGTKARFALIHLKSFVRFVRKHRFLWYRSPRLR